MLRKILCFLGIHNWKEGYKEFICRSPFSSKIEIYSIHFWCKDCRETKTETWEIPYKS